MAVVNEMSSSFVRPRWRLSTASASSIVVAALMAAAIPTLIAALWLKVLTSVVIYALTAASIALLYRKLGQVSLAQVAFMGCGGWVSLRLAYGTGLPFELNILAGGLFAAVVGMIFAYPALRMRGLYLALVTLMAAGGFGILINVVQFPNGGEGFFGFAVKAASYMPRHGSRSRTRPISAIAAPWSHSASC